MMNLLVLLSSCILVMADIDWSNINEMKIPVEEILLPPLFKLNENRIVGGNEATPHEFPHQVALIGTLADGRQGFCGGSLISKQYVLTAAHCVDGVESAKVILGAHKVREHEIEQIHLNSTDFIIHENWDPKWVRNDIALVKLPEQIQMNENIQIIKLFSTSNDDFEGQSAVVSGWGRDTDASPAISPVLKFIDTSIVSNMICFLSYPFLIRDSHICTSGKNQKSACNGDSGGPLIANLNNTFFQIGIVSFGRSDGCEKGHPAVFSRITSFAPWIKKHSDADIVE